MPHRRECVRLAGGRIAFDFLVGSVGALARTALGQTVGRAVHLENVDMVGQAVQAVEQGAC